MLELLTLAARWLSDLALAVAWLGVSALAISMAICCMLLLRLSAVADRAIIFDLVMIHVVGLIALGVIVLNYPLLIDTLLVVAVLGFLGTVAIARYLERGLPRAKPGALPLPERDASEAEAS